MNEGRKAFRAGLRLLDNPYRGKKGQAWKTGWMAEWFKRLGEK